MTNYIITEAGLDIVRAALSIPEHADEGENAAAMIALQSLPEVQPTVTQSEPVEYLLGGMRVKLNFNTMGNITSLRNMEHDLQGRWVCFVGAENNKHLKATSPKLTPITADELDKLHHIEEFGLFCSFEEFEQIARAIEHKHGIVKHRSEAK